MCLRGDEYSLPPQKYKRSGESRPVEDLRLGRRRAARIYSLLPMYYITIAIDKCSTNVFMFDECVHVRRSTYAFDLQIRPDLNALYICHLRREIPRHFTLNFTTNPTTLLAFRPAQDAASPHPTSFPNPSKLFSLPSRARVSLQPS